MPLSARYGDPALDTIARSIFTLFPRCIRCGERIERFEEAEVRILTNRVAHALGCRLEEGLGPRDQGLVTSDQRPATSD